MKRCLFPILFGLLSLQLMAQQAILHKQHSFPKTVPAGNYSGITWIGGDRYAVVNDKSATAGFHLMTIQTDSLTGDILEVRADSFMTSGQPNRDEEGVCYVPKTNTVFVSGEADGQIIEYGMDGRLTGRRLVIPEVFATANKNSGFEALTYNAATRRFWTTSENTLKADAGNPDIKSKTANLLRMQSFGDDLQPREQFWYLSDSSVAAGEVGQSTLGISGMAALNDGRLVVLEREVFHKPKNIGSFVHVKLYMVDPYHQRSGSMLEKQLITEFRTKINITDRSFANYEGICVGPRLKDGRILLILVADSQDQYKGYLKDWFRTVVLPNPDSNSSAFLSHEELPNAARYIAEPPKPGDGTFENDTYYYKWGKELRQTPRGDQAALDEVQKTSKAFSSAVGFMISPEETPEIFKLVEGARKDARAANRQAKNYFRRTRPYVYFQEPSINPATDKEYSTSYSFPSGHSVRGWVYALTLALIVPDSTETLIARAQEFAINRVICGRHWKSDVDASLVEATAIMSRLLSNAAFLEQLEKARREYARLHRD